MATPDAWSFTGTNVTGAGVTYNYTLEFEAITNAINALTTTLGETNVLLTTANTNFLAAFGPGTTFTTPGTIANSLKAMSGHVETIGSATGASAKELSGIHTTFSGDLTKLAATISTIGSSANALQQISIAQQNKKAQFEKAATQAALKRSGLPEVEVPQTDINQAIQDSVTDAGTVALQANVNGFVQSQITNAATFVGTETLEFIKDTATYQQAVIKIDGIKASIGNIFTSSAAAAEIDQKKAEAAAKDLSAGHT